MRINNNLMAMNTHRQLGIANNSSSKSMEKLSSGYRINRAGDDAAGLSISEKMRGQIRGLTQASRNGQDAISLVQTAEGALNETQAILQRMRELAVQSATDTNVDVDREALQNEIDQLATEISRISSTTEFNTKSLLDGTFEGVFHIGANDGQNMSLAIGAMDAVTLKVGTELEAQMTYSVSAAITEGTAGNANDGVAGAAVDCETGTYSVVEIADYEGSALVNANVEGGDATSVTHVLVDEDGNAVGTSTDGSKFYAIGNVAADNSGVDTEAGKTEATDGTRASLTVAAGATQVEVTAADAATVTVATELEEGQTLKAGDYSVVEVDTNKFELQDGSENAVAYSTDGATWTTELGAGDTILTTETLADGAKLTMGEAGVDGIDISSQKTASAAITTINDALDKVSAERSKLGATQNRLEHTIKNLDTSAENLQAAESRIRDVDMAKEMMEFTKNNILQQAAQAMLAQANQAPQGVLQLLR